MNNQFDERLSGKIRDVFDNYEDNLADEGWKKLRTKYPAKKQRSPFLYWISSAAAVILIASGIWLFNPSGKQPEETNIAKVPSVEKQQPVRETKKAETPKSEEQETSIDRAQEVAGKPKQDKEPVKREYRAAKAFAKKETTDTQEKTENAPEDPAPAAVFSAKKRETTSPAVAERVAPVEEKIKEPAIAIQEIKPEIKSQEKQLPISVLTATELKQKQAPVQEEIKAPVAKIELQPVPSLANKTEVTTSNKQVQAQVLARVETKEKPVSLPAKEVNKPIIIAKTEVEPPINSKEKLPVKPESARILASAEAKEKPSLLSVKEEKKPVSKAKIEQKVTFGVYAGSFVNYAEGSDNKLNLGAGFSSDIALSKNLRFSTGIGISKNELSFNRGNIPQTSSGYESAAYSSDALKSNGVVSGIENGKPYYDLAGYDASLLGLDIPTNLKFLLPKRKDQLFISAGISSGGFLNQTYSYNYRNINPLAASMDTQQKTDETSKNGIGSFEVARTFNFSFGVGYPIGKQNKLVIEPFVRYPLRDMGQEKLRFGAGGVNLKLNFETNKK